MELNGKRIAVLATHGFEQSELEGPRDRLKKAGATVEVISLASDLRPATPATSRRSAPRSSRVREGRHSRRSAA
jgi:putative intracellular protease/amidase